MKLKAIEILNMFEAFTKLADKELDLSTACIIAKNIKELAISKDIIDEKRNKIIREFARKDEENNIIQSENGNIEIEDVPNFNLKISELLNTEIDITITPIKQMSLSDIKIPPKDILPLMDIIKE